MCVPIDDDLSAGRLGFGVVDRPVRLRLVADTYGLDGDGRHELIEHLDRSMRSGGAFVQRRVDAGDPNFIRMLEEMGGMERYERRLRWWEESRHSSSVPCHECSPADVPLTGGQGHLRPGSVATNAG